MQADAGRDPAVLWQALLSAREAVAYQRRLPHGAAMIAARADLLRALEAYVEGLLRRRLPVPYAMRDELRLQRLTAGPVRNSGGPDRR